VIAAAVLGLVIAWARKSSQLAAGDAPARTATRASPLRPHKDLIWTARLTSAEDLTTAYIGGYRLSNVAQRKLQRVTREQCLLPPADSALMAGPAAQTALAHISPASVFMRGIMPLSIIA
jgi:hypothetical protein